MMSKRFLTCLAFLAALGLLATGCDKGSTSASGTPGKSESETYGKKLAGVWEATEEVKGEKPETVTMEFKADGGFKATMGPFDMTGNWKLLKEEGKTVTVETEVSLKGFGDGKTDKKSFSIVFEDANTITMSRIGDRPDPKKLKRKS
jgi:hypothetical protein